MLSAGAHAGNWLDDFRNAADKGKTTTVLAIDNDSLLLNRDDGFYTSGLGVGQQYALRDGTRADVWGWRLGQELYTAADINLPPSMFGPPDHPYAAWLHGGIFNAVQHGDGTYRRIGLDIGCLGPCAGGKWTQTNLHRLLNQPLPQGWDKQVRNEWGAMLYGEMAPVRWKFGDAVDLTPVLHGRFGNIHTDAGIDMTLRAGRLNVMPQESTLHGFVRMGARAVGYNATLQGGYFSDDSPHVVRPKRFVGEAEAGVEWKEAGYGISASVIRRSNEISGLHNSIGNQNFVRLLFSYTP